MNKNEKQVLSRLIGEGEEIENKFKSIIRHPDYLNIAHLIGDAVDLMEQSSLWSPSTLGNILHHDFMTLPKDVLDWVKCYLEWYFKCLDFLGHIKMLGHWKVRTFVENKIILGHHLKLSKNEFLRSQDPDFDRDLPMMLTLYPTSRITFQVEFLQKLLENPPK